MSRSNNSLSIRLNLRDSETVRRALINLGADGERALERITQAGDPASRSLLALDGAAGEARGGLEDLAGRGGAVSSVLMGLGPSGIVAGAAIGGLVALGVAAKQAASEVAEIKRAAEIAGVSTDYFQEMTYAAAQYRIAVDDVQDTLRELGLRADEFALTGEGSAADAFERLGFTASEVHASLNDLPGLLEEITRRMEGLDKQAQIRIADEIFGGEGGERMVRLLSQGADEVARLRAEARGAGMVLDASVIDRADALTVQFENATNLLRTQFNQVLMESVGLIEGLASAMEGLAWVMRELRSPSLGDLRAKEVYLTRQRDELAELEQAVSKWEERLRSPNLRNRQRQQYEERLSAARESLSEQAALVAEVERERNRIEAELNGTLPDTPSPSVETVGRGAAPPDPEAEKQAEKTAARIAALSREVEQLEALSAAHLQSADAVKTVQIARAADNELQALSLRRTSQEGQQIVELVTRQQELQAAIKERQEAEAEGKRLTESLRTPQEVYNAALARMNYLLAEGTISQGVYQRAVDEAQNTLRESDQVFQMVRETGESAFDTVTRSMRSSVEAGKGLFAGLRDGAVSALWDIADTAMQLALINPIKNSIFGLAGSAALPTFTFADGGVMTSSGPLPLRAYSAGGIANSPQLALYGEAGPEAYVPLPDGRTIPVTLTMKGAGDTSGGGQPIINIIDQRKAGSPDIQPQTRESGGDLASGGPISSALGQSFGVSRRGY